MKDIPSFYNLLLGTRVAMMLFVLKNRGRDDLFMDIDSIVTDVRTKLMQIITTCCFNVTTFMKFNMLCIKVTYKNVYYF